jgi:hypothetical protein
MTSFNSRPISVQNPKHSLLLWMILQMLRVFWEQLHEFPHVPNQQPCLLQLGVDQIVYRQTSCATIPGQKRNHPISPESPMYHPIHSTTKDDQQLRLQPIVLPLRGLPSRNPER